MQKKNGKVAIVTGGNRGLGRQVVCQLAGEHGYAVILCGRKLSEAERAVAQLRETIRPDALLEAAQLDVTNEEQIQRLVSFVQSRFGRVDALVNNAGAVFEEGWPSILETSVESVLKTLENNTTSALRVTQAFVPLLLEGGGGNVVMVSSGMASLSDMGTHHFAYRLSKAVMNVLTLMLHAELGDRGLRVNSVCPGFVKTELTPANATADREIPDGARGITWAATLGAEGPRGAFFRDSQPIEW